MESSDDDTLSERSCVSEPSFRSERSCGSLSPCTSSTLALPGDTLPWNLSKHERRKRKSQDSVLDPAERAVVRVADERDRVQKKTFTKWINKHLIKVRKHINDLYEDLREGHNLISLLEVLSGVALPREKGRMRFHRLQNVEIALNFLKQRQVKLVNIRNDDITDGNPKLTLGLIWTIILHFQISEIYVSGESADLTAKEKLLLWCRHATETYPGLHCVNFTSSWSDGRLFNALLHRYRPDLIDMEVVSQQSNRQNLEQAFEIAESLGVTRLLDAEDVDVATPDEKSVITYVSSIYDAFPKIPEGGDGIPAHEVDQRWSEYQSRFSSLLQWTLQQKSLMDNKSFPQNPAELKALYNEYVHFKETEIPNKQAEKSQIEHLYKLLEVWMEFGRIKLPKGLHPNDLEEEWGKLIVEMLVREKALRAEVERVEVLLQRANKIQNMALDCEEKLTLAKNTLQADMSRIENGEPVQCESELACYLQDCESLIQELNQDLKVLRAKKYYQVEQLTFRVSCLQEELVSFRLQCSSVYRKGHFSQTLGSTGADYTDAGLSVGQTLLGALGAVGAIGAAVLRRPMARSELVAMSSSEDEGSLRFIYELLGWVEETQELLEQAEWGADLPSVEKHLQEHNNIHSAVKELLSGLQEARSYQNKVSTNFRSSYSETLAKLEHQYCKLLEQSSWRLQSLESLQAFVSHCTEELIWLNEREEEEVAFDWGPNNTDMKAKRELYSEMRLELDEKRGVMRSLQETAHRLCQENHPAKQTVEAYSAALQTQCQWVDQLCVCVEQHLKDNTSYFQFMSDARECESHLRQLHDTIKRQYTCDKNSRLSKLEDLLQDSMEEKEQLIEYRSTVASLMGRAKTVVQLRPRNPDCVVGSTTPIRAVCDYRQIEITINRGEECVLEENSQRTKWKVISPTGNEAMVPSVCFTVPPPNQDAIDTASRTEQMYQKVMSLWHQLHVNMKSVVSWNYLIKDIAAVSEWNLDSVQAQEPTERQQALDRLESQLSDFLCDSKESSLFTPAERRELEVDVQHAQQHCKDLLLSLENMERDESMPRTYLSELKDITLRLNEVEQALLTRLQTPPPSLLSGDTSADNMVLVREQEKLQSELDNLRSHLSSLSPRCVSFLKEKPTSPSAPALRSELNQTMEKMDKVHQFSSSFLHLTQSLADITRKLEAAEGLVRKQEETLSEEYIIPADNKGIQDLQGQLREMKADVVEQESVLKSLQSQLDGVKEAGSDLSRLQPDRSLEPERFQEKTNSIVKRWSEVQSQIETRLTDLDSLASELQQYREGHAALLKWIIETTERQENAQVAQTDSKALTEQLAQQTALVAEIEQNQTKLDDCQTHSKGYCKSVKSYELQLMTYKAYVESIHNLPVKRRRIQNSSDAITHEFMDLRTRYTALVTLTTQHIKYISDALRRLEEEEKEMEEEKQTRVSQVSDLLGWVKGLQGRAAGSNSAAAQQAINDQLAAKKEEVAEAVRSTQVFLLSKQASKLSPEERGQVEALLDELTNTYSQQLEQQLAKEEDKKKKNVITGVIDLGTVETYSIFQAAQRGLIDQDTALSLLEAQLVMTGGLIHPDDPEGLSLEQSLAQGLIDVHTEKCLSELAQAVVKVESGANSAQQQNVLLAVKALELGLIRDEAALRILELEMNTGGLRKSDGALLSLAQAAKLRLLPQETVSKLQCKNQSSELIDPSTAEKLTLSELQQRCVPDDSGFLFLPVKQQPGGTVCLRSGRKVGIFRAVQEGLIDRKVTVRLLEAQLFAGGIADPRSGHRLTIQEAVRHGLMDQDLACAMLSRQLNNGGLIDPFSRERLNLDESIDRDLLSPRLALLVLECLHTFQGMLWPESGELMAISEAVKQGMVSADLARKILKQRHDVGALYNPETLKVVPLKEDVGGLLHPQLVRVLQQISILDLHSSMKPLGSSSMNWLSSARTSSYPSTPQSVSLQSDPPPEKEKETSEQKKEKMVFHVMTNSYIDANSGKRLLVLDQELVSFLSTTVLGSSINSDRPSSDQVWAEGKMDGEVDVQPVGELEIKEEESIAEESSKEATEYNGAPPASDAKDKYVGRSPLQHPSSASFKFDDCNDPNIECTAFATWRKTTTVFPKPEDSKLSPEVVLDLPKDNATQVEDQQREEDSQPTLGKDRVQEETILVEASSAVAFSQEEIEKEVDDFQFKRLVLDLQQGGLLTEDGERLLPDEAVAQGVLPSHTVVQLMAQAGLFGGFIDPRSGNALSLEDVMQEGIEDEELMWSVLESDKTVAGIVDMEKSRLCGVREAALAGLIDPKTADRLLEAQVVSGGIVDPVSSSKVSVTFASELGLIDESQKEELVALEKAFQGNNSDKVTTFNKASLQLQMSGVIDPLSGSPVPLEQAITKGLVSSEIAYQVLARQVAEGGIIHHPSRIRLSVADAVERGLVDRSIAPGLEELELVYRGQPGARSFTEAATFQASTGAITDPSTGSKLTLNKAVSKGLLDENKFEEAMASANITQGLLDPKTAKIVPYADLVNQANVDIETGQRFLQVGPFRGVKSLTLHEGVSANEVDPVPALRLLQSQADSGGIIDIATGERCCLSEALNKHLLSEDMAKTIAINQFRMGGLGDAATGQRVSNVNDAVVAGLIPANIAVEIQEKMAHVDGAAPIPSSDDVHSPHMELTVASTDSPSTWSDGNTEKPSPLSDNDFMNLNTDATCEAFEQSAVVEMEVEEVSPVLEEETSIVGPDQSIDMLSEFATNVERRIQQAIEEIVPQIEMVESIISGEKSDKIIFGCGELVEVVEELKDDCSKSQDVSVAHLRDETFEEPLVSLPKTGDLGSEIEEIKMPHGVEQEIFDKSVSNEKGVVTEAALSVEQTKAKSKKKRKGKKKEKAMEDESETGLAKTNQAVCIDLREAEDGADQRPSSEPNKTSFQKGSKGPEIKGMEGSNGTLEEKDYRNTFEHIMPKQEQTVSTGQQLTSDTDVLKNICGKKEARHEAEKDLDSQKYPEVQSTTVKDFPRKSTLPDEQKAALILKAKERILKKVFEPAVSDKQAAEELKALRKEAGKKESGSSKTKELDQDLKTPKESGDKAADEESVEQDATGLVLETSIPKIDATALNEEAEAASSTEPRQTQQSKRNKKKKMNISNVAEQPQVAAGHQLVDEKVGVSSEAPEKDQTKTAPSVTQDNTTSRQFKSRVIEPEMRKPSVTQSQLPVAAPTQEPPLNLPELTQSTSLHSEDKSDDWDSTPKSNISTTAHESLNNLCSQAMGESPLSENKVINNHEIQSNLAQLETRGDVEDKTLQKVQTLPGKYDLTTENIKSSTAGEKLSTDDAPSSEGIKPPVGENLQIPPEGSESELMSEFPKEEFTSIDTKLNHHQDFGTLAEEKYSNKASISRIQMSSLELGTKESVQVSSTSDQVEDSFECLNGKEKAQMDVFDLGNTNLDSVASTDDVTPLTKKESPEQRGAEPARKDTADKTFGKVPSLIVPSENSGTSSDVNEKPESEILARKLNPKVRSDPDLTLEKESVAQGTYPDGQLESSIPSKDTRVVVRQQGPSYLLQPEDVCISSGPKEQLIEDDKKLGDELLDSERQSTVDMESVIQTKENVNQLSQEKPSDLVQSDKTRQWGMTLQTESSSADAQESLCTDPNSKLHPVSTTESESSVVKPASTYVQGERATVSQPISSSPDASCLLSEDPSSESTEISRSDTTAESLDEDYNAHIMEDTLLSHVEAASVSGQSSLARQECLEHDQRIVALVSMVRHLEVRLKQQQQQAVGRGLIALDDIIRHTESLDLELSDLEPQINSEVEIAENLSKAKATKVPPQLLLALEKDGCSLARGYRAARTLSDNVLQSLRSNRDSVKAAVLSEQQSLGEQVLSLLSWLQEVNGRMDVEIAEDKKKDVDVQDQLKVCEELQSSLTSRSGEVNSVAAHIQVFISERGMDLEPEQSRNLLGQLQQLQTSFHCTSGQVQAWSGSLAAQQRVRAAEMDKLEQCAREREVVQQQTAECSQKLEGLSMWLAGAASLLANQRAGSETDDMSVLQEKQKNLKEVQKTLQGKGEAIAEAIRSVEDFLAERGDNLSAEERDNLKAALAQMKEQYNSLTHSADTLESDLDTAISATVQQNTQKAKAVEETQLQMDSLLNELSTLHQSNRGVDHVSGLDITDSSSQPAKGVMSHTESLQAELQQLQAQQAKLLTITQSTRALLDQPDSIVPPEEKQRLRASLDQLQAQHQDKLQSCQDRLRKSEALKEELTKFQEEHEALDSWMDQCEQELRHLGEGETDAKGLKERLEEHRKLAEDIICHKADLRFVQISGQKVEGSVLGALEQAGGSDPALNNTKAMVDDKLRDANQRYTNLHIKSSELGGRLSGLLERYQQYQDQAVSLHSWLSAQEQNESIAKASGEVDPQNLQNSLRQVQLLQDELAERSVQLEKVKREGRDLVSTEEAPSLKAVDILCTADGLEKRFGSLSASVSERAEQLQTAMAQSVSVQEGLKGLLSWLDMLVLNPGPVEPTAQAVQDALTQNQKLRQELLSRQNAVEAMQDSVSKLFQSSDASTASGLQSSLDELTHKYSAAQSRQVEREGELKALLPRLESFERLGADLEVFTQSRLKALSPVGQPDRSVVDYRETIQEVRSEMELESAQLKTFCNTGSELSTSGALQNTQKLTDQVRLVSDAFNQLEADINERFAATQMCEQQLLQFRSLSGSLQRWLQTAQEQLPSKEVNHSTESLQRRVHQLQELSGEWESQGSRVQELNKTGSELETLVIDITAPQTKPGVPHINGSAAPGSVNGIHTCKDLTELQVAVTDVNGRYGALGVELKDRLAQQQSALDMRQKAKQEAEELAKWLADQEETLKQGQSGIPSKPELIQAQAQENKALMSELAERSSKVEELKSSLRKLIAENPDSPEAESWRQQLQDIDSRWHQANHSAAQRQTELENCADRLGSFSTAANQLGPWLREKELMMSVLGPLSIDPNMLNTQKQQVQFMMREFETRKPQFEQLTQSAQGILSQAGDAAQEPKELAEVQAELGSISQQWNELTSKLSQRSNNIDQAKGTSEQFQHLLRELSSSVAALGERLDTQASLSAQPEALKHRLQETGEIRSELERRQTELAEAERLCQELSDIVAEPYLKDELKKRLESVSGPLRSLEERAADSLSQLQAALSSTQQFQQMFEELRSWLDREAQCRESPSESYPCHPEALRSLLAESEELQRGIASHRGSYELIQAEGASLLAALPAADPERSTLQDRLSLLRQDWENMNQQASDRENQLKTTLNKAEAYQQHKGALLPWLVQTEQKDSQMQPSLDACELDEALQKVRGLTLDLERQRPLLEQFNSAADKLLERCCIGEDEVRDEKAQLNQRVEKLAESLGTHTSQLEELAARLKEFEDGRQAVERRLEAAKHQIEVQEALGAQACSTKSLERLRTQQENLGSLQNQVVYLRDLAHGLVQDAPQRPEGGSGGAQKLLEQARDTEKDYKDVSDKMEQCCSQLESRLQGVASVQSHVRDIFSRLADLDDELDSLGPVGRDADSLASQADLLKGFQERLGCLRTELDQHAAECTTMLRREGSSPDLLALRRETEALIRQAGKLSERGQARLDQVQDAASRVQEFYRQVAELQALLAKAEDGLNAESVVATEVETIKQQLKEFKAVERQQVDTIQPKLQHVNAVGQGLIQSAAKHTDTQALEHDLETTNLRWNSLNKRVAERIAQLQEALLHCGKFQDALEPLLSWLCDTEELVANQKPPSAEYRVVKAQIQEQKLLQRLLDDRRPTVEMIRAEGERIAATAESPDQEKIQSQLQSLAERWTDLTDKASNRQRQLEELQVLALQFHEALEPLGEWLSATERRLSSAEPMGTQTAKITQQIVKHKALQEDVFSRAAEVEHLESLSQSLETLCCEPDRDWLRERVDTVRTGHSDLADWCARRESLLEQALANAQLFGEEEVEVMNWLAEVAQRLSQVSVQSYLPQVLAKQHKETLSLNEEILSRKRTVDQAIKNGQALLKQTTGEEVLLINEKIDGIKSRYAEMTAGSSKALRTLEQALQLSTRFSSAHDNLNQWLDAVEAELSNAEPDASPAYQERQKELKKVAAEKRLVLDTVNEVGSALLDLVPWRAREGLDRLVSDANQRYRQADDTITQRVQLVQAAIQRSQQYEEAVDAELAWVAETERKLASLGPLSLEPDVTVAQLQVQKAFNIDIIRHKDTVDQLLLTRDDITDTCSDAQKDALMVKTDSLIARYEAVSQNHSERFSALEQAQVLVARFWETYEELDPWLGETEALITQLPPAAIDIEALRVQQGQIRLLRESIAEHKPHIDKLLKIGPQLAELSHQEGAAIIQRYTEAERRYLAIKEDVKGRSASLDEAVSQSAQFHDKMDPLLETLESAVQRLRQPPSVAAEVEKIREQLAEHRAQNMELDKLLPSFTALCARGEELIGRAAHDDPAAQAVSSCLLRLRSLWDEIRRRAEQRETKLNDVLDLAGKFWSDVAALLSTLRDSQDIVRDLEDPGVDPSLIKQQIEAAEAIKAETDGLREELEFVRTLGADLIFACGETEKPEVKKTIDEMNSAWEGLNRTWHERMERLEEAMTASVQYQDSLQSMFDYLDNAVIKLCEMSTVGTDLGTVKQQIEELKQYKVEVYQQQIDMEKLCHQGELLLKKVSDPTDRDMIQAPLVELRHLWDNLGDKITQRQHKLEAALLALGQFQHALSELQAWLSHTHNTLDTQRPVSSDPKAIEIELAKHHVLRNDVLSHHATVETVNSAAAELLESSPGDEASHLRDQLDQLNQSWQSLLLKTQDRQKLLEGALQQAEGFHGELEDFLQWLRRTESQLSAAKPTGGLPETAKEQLQQHMELQAHLSQRADQYHRLLDQGESMLLARGGEDAGPGATQTQQNLLLLQNKWASLNTKMDDRRVKLEEAVSLATCFQTSLQEIINWLTQAEQTLNMAQPPSLVLDTVLFQIDEHKVFVNEVNTHRDHVLALEKTGSQLRFASLNQDVVLIKNLLLSVQARWDKLVQRSLDRGRHLDEARKRAKQFHEAWRKLSDWLEEAERKLDSELEISNEPDKIKVQLSKHKEFQKVLGSKQPVYDTAVRSGKAMKDKAQLPADKQKLDDLVGEVRDKWDTVCGKSVERQHKLEEALLFSGQFAEALQALVDWLYRVEPQLAEDQPVHGDLDLVSNLVDSHKAFQKELGKRTSSVQALKRSARDLMETSRDDTAWVKVQLQELSNRWDTVCALSVTKQSRLQVALKQAEEFRTAVQMLLEWLSEAEQTLRFRGVLPEEAETLQALLHTHRDFMASVEEKRSDVNKAAGLGEAILTVCHPDSITTIKHWITIIRARFEEVFTWAKQHEQRLDTALTEVLNNASLLEELLSWLQWAETTLVQRDLDSLPQDIPELKTLITEHQVFMEEMTRKQPDVDKVTKTYKRKPAESSLAERRGARKQQQQQTPMQVSGGNPRLNQLCARWQQVWLLALDRQRKLNDALDRLEELREFANFDFDVWRKKYMRWMNHKKSRVMDFFRRIDKDQDGKITRQEFIDGILASKFPTSRLEMTAVADIFDSDGDGYIDYYEFVAALHPNKDAYRPTTDADKIEDEVTRQVAQCKCAKRFQVEQIGENKYRFYLGNQFGDSQQLRLVRILRSTVMVRVGGGWMALDEFLVKNDPCRVQHPGLKILRSDSSSSISSRLARGRTNLELREKFILPEGAQSLATFRTRGQRSKPGSRNASPTRSSSSASHSGTSLPTAPCGSGTTTPSSRSSHSRDYAKPWLAHSKSPSSTKSQSGPELGHGLLTPGHEGAASASKLKRRTLNSSRGSLTGENGGTSYTSKTPVSDSRRGASTASGGPSRAGSQAGSRASSRRGSDASDGSELQDNRSVCSDTSDTPRRAGGGARPSKIPTSTKKRPGPKSPKQ
ncbi:microtubule-actin cross-linking factor 1 isoform X20 [Synchiropus splendidus]|uniref:microtubule-actin cross-linking factor 1 isoform X20 n=1 Tax=Synchiropus splendidus TaxID=270530 RepID=UPI00237D449A|nr:microtubule-actin cross-linking factor 1 isoform X20 [Synchiropus splendidus]